MGTLVAEVTAIPSSFPAEVIGLPTKGVVIDSVEAREKGGAHWRLDGRILSVDPAALVAAQRYGNDYDDIISGYPAIFWVGWDNLFNDIRCCMTYDMRRPWAWE